MELSEKHVFFISALAVIVLYSFVFWQDYPLLDNSRDPQVGPQNAAVDVVIFADYSTSRSAAFLSEVMWPLIEEYRGRVRFVFKMFPMDKRCNPEVISMLPSCDFAEALLCADAQGGFEAYSKAAAKLVLEDMNSLPGGLTPGVHVFSERELYSLAGQAGLDKEEFAVCIKQHGSAGQIRDNAMESRLYYISATPAVLVGYMRISGADLSAEDFNVLLKNGIEKELSRHA
ncbi:MAG: thioredoxin domain-containing protein [Candidatus Diapherotrites archaeon]